MNDQTDLLSSKVDADVKAHQDGIFEPLRKASDRRAKQIKNIEEKLIPESEQRLKSKYT
jgi:hypothetical protein